MQGISDAELFKVSEEFVNGLKVLNDSQDWKVKEEKPILVCEKEFQDRIIAKANMILNLPFEQVFSFFSDPNFMKILSDQVAKLQVVYDNKIVRVIHVIMQLPGPISDREVMAVNTVKIEGNKAYVGNRSCRFTLNKHPDTVIAELHVAGFILEKIDAGRTSVTNISDVDVKGSIPGFIKNAMASKRVENLSKLQEKIRQAKK